MREIVKLGVQKRTSTSFVALEMRSEGNAPKNGEPTVGFSFTIMLHHTCRFGQGFLVKKNVTTLEHPILSYPGSNRFLTVPPTGISTEGTAILRCY
jgi:hypothetical protein